MLALTKPYDVVFYHDNCPDGLVAAWLHRQFLEASLENLTNDPRPVTTEYVPCTYSTTPSIQDLAPLVQGKRVLMVDFSYRRALMLEIKGCASEFHVLDHHKTSEKALEGVKGFYFDSSKSGCQMVWDSLKKGFFQLDPTADKRAFETLEPWFLGPIGRRDIWAHSEEDSALHAFWQSQMARVGPGAEESFYRLWTMVQEAGVTGNKKYSHEGDQRVATGKAILEFKYRRNKQTIVEGSPYITRGKYAHYGVRNYTYVLVSVPRFDASECLNQAIEQYGVDFAASFTRNFREQVWEVSLRSLKGSNVDVSKIAEIFGGGGHKHAAGYSSKNLYPFVEEEFHV